MYEWLKRTFLKIFLHSSSVPLLDYLAIETTNFERIAKMLLLSFEPISRDLPKFHFLQILEHCIILYIELLEKKKLKAWQGGLIQLTFNYKSAHQSFVKC